MALLLCKDLYPICSGLTEFRLILAIVVGFLLIKIVLAKSSKNSPSKPSTTYRDATTPHASLAQSQVSFKYKRKPYIMTRNECQFYKTLLNVVDNKYFVFPQVHLTSILDHKIKNGQFWKAAFSYINQKSVDFVICDTDFARPLLAIELDDWSHHNDEQHEKDLIKDRIFEDAGLPLVRFENAQRLSNEDIASRLGLPNL